MVTITCQYTGVVFEADSRRQKNHPKVSRFLNSCANDRSNPSAYNLAQAAFRQAKADGSMARHADRGTPVMFAEHIIGLRANEFNRPEQAANVAERFAAIATAGALRPRTDEKPTGEDGSLFALDRLAGDNQYVFLSVGPRYRLSRPAELTYGWAFDAEELVLAGALVGPDMLSHYEDLMEACIAEAASALPPLDPISDEELAEFASIAGDDPAMLAYVREQSVKRDDAIDMAIRCGDMDTPGAEEAVALFLSRVTALQAQWRKSGAEALAMLGDGMEVLVKGSLPLVLAIGAIEEGKL